MDRISFWEEHPDRLLITRTTDGVMLDTNMQRDNAESLLLLVEEAAELLAQVVNEGFENRLREFL